MTAIRLKNINKSFDKEIFKNYSLEIEKGELVAIVGKSGSGKSTLLNIIGGLEKIDSGIVEINECEITKKNLVNIYKKEISFLFQNFALVDEWTTLKNLELVEKNKEKIKIALKQVGLETKINEKIYALSGGEQQRVALARVILQNNDIILADEPTGSLDKDNRDIIFNLLANLNKEGKTVVIVTHDEELSSKCSKIIKIN